MLTQNRNCKATWILSILISWLSHKLQLFLTVTKVLFRDERLHHYLYLFSCQHYLRHSPVWECVERTWTEVGEIDQKVLFKPLYKTDTNSYWYIHSYTAMQGANQHIRSSLGFSILPKDELTCRSRELNQWPTDSTTLALPASLTNQVFQSLIEMCCRPERCWKSWKQFEINVHEHKSCRL